MATQLREPDLTPEEQGAEAAPNDNEQAGERDFEAEARARGWKPEAEFAEGEPRPRKFKDAEAFIRDGEEQGELAKGEVKRLQVRLDKAERIIRKLTMAEQAAYTRGMEAAKAELRAAAESGDMAAFDAAEAKIDALSASAPKEDLAHGENPNVEFINFRDDNAWYDRGGLPSATAMERGARAFADRTAERFAAEGLMKELAPSAFFARIADEVSARYPGLGAQTVGTARQKPASDVSGVTRPGNGKANGAANLPPDARKQAIRFFEDGTIRAKTQAEAIEKFARDYFSQ